MYVKIYVKKLKLTHVTEVTEVPHFLPTRSYIYNVNITLVK